MSEISQIDDCFKNLVVFTDCCVEDDQDAIYIDNIPGISLKKAAKVTDQDLKGSTFLDRIIKEAIRLTVEDFKAELASEFQFHTVIDSAKIGRIPSAYDASVSGNVGIKIDSLSSDPFVSTRVDYISYYSPYMEERTFYYKDDSITITFCESLVAGENKITINRNIVGCEAFFYTDAATRSVASEYGCQSDCGCSSQRCYYCSSNCFDVRGYTEPTGGSKTYQTETLGFVASLSCVCSTSELLCRYRSELKYAVRIKAAILFFKFQQNSTNAGSLFVRNSTEIIHNNLIDLEGGTNQYSGLKKTGEYNKALKNVVKQVLPSIKSQRTKCLSCGDNRIRIISAHP